MKYKVTLKCLLPMEASVEVEANSQEEAEDNVWERFLRGKITLDNDDPMYILDNTEVTAEAVGK